MNFNQKFTLGKLKNPFKRMPDSILVRKRTKLVSARSADTLLQSVMTEIKSNSVRRMTTLPPPKREDISASRLRFQGISICICAAASVIESRFMEPLLTKDVKTICVKNISKLYFVNKVCKIKSNFVNDKSVLFFSNFLFGATS